MSTTTSLQSVRWPTLRHSSRSGADAAASPGGRPGPDCAVPAPGARSPDRRRQHLRAEDRRSGADVPIGGPPDRRRHRRPEDVGGADRHRAPGKSRRRRARRPGAGIHSPRAGPSGRRGIFGPVTEIYVRGSRSCSGCGSRLTTWPSTASSVRLRGTGSSPASPGSIEDCRVRRPARQAATWFQRRERGTAASSEPLIPCRDAPIGRATKAAVCERYGPPEICRKITITSTPNDRSFGTG